MEEKIDSKESCATISVNGIPVLDASIDGKQHQFFFDSGAMASAVSDSTAVRDFAHKKIATFGSNAGADRKKKKNRILTVAMKSALFESDNKVVLFSPFPKSKCSKETPIKGLIGLDAFFSKGFSLLLDFSNNSICNVKEADLQSRLSDGSFRELKSQCKNNQVFIFLEIDSIEYKFKLDTGFTGNLMIPYSESLDFSKYNALILEGGLFQTIHSTAAGVESYYEKIPVTFAGQKFESKLNVSTSIKAQNIGINFIKNFEWLIDYNKNKVYVRRNQNKMESTFNRKISYYAKASDDQLTIVVKEKSQTRFQLGDKIKTVNGQKVTAENNCELQDLLNKTEDWNTLQLDVIPSQK